MPDNFLLEGIATGIGDAAAQALRDRNERRRAEIETAAREQQRQTARKESLEDFENQLRLRESFKVEGEKKEGKATAQTRQEALGAVGQIFDIGAGVSPQEKQQQTLSILGGVSPGAGEFARDYLKMFEDDDPGIDGLIGKVSPSAFTPASLDKFSKTGDYGDLIRLAKAAKVVKKKPARTVTIDRQVYKEKELIEYINGLLDEMKDMEEEKREPGESLSFMRGDYAKLLKRYNEAKEKLAEFDVSKETEEVEISNEEQKAVDIINKYLPD